MSPNPIRMFHGAADNYVPVAPCRGFVERLKAKGANVTLTEYPGAHHVFDGRAFKTPVTAAKSQSTRGCELAEAKGGRLGSLSATPIRACSSDPPSRTTRRRTPSR